MSCNAKSLKMRKKEKLLLRFCSVSLLELVGTILIVLLSLSLSAFFLLSNLPFYLFIPNISSC